MTAKGSEGELRLVEPTVDLCDSYCAMVREFGDAGEPFHQAGRDELGDFARFVRTLHNQSRGTDLPEGYVPCTTYWAVRGATVVGTVRLRHRLTPPLEIIGGHIGYDVRPSERRKGYATRMLAMALEKAGALGLERALVTCDVDNVVSARVIRSNGGVLADEVVSPRTGKPSARYWIDLRRE